ncbi:MAG: cytochrome P460 family protein [Deferrisomatales bacterium]|nr:cytochrome P460 family protein [Deferrisomatales bacterium]
MKRMIVTLVASLGAGALLWACAAQTGAQPTPTGADLSGTALWSSLQAQKYTTWKMWPGKTALYQGTEPHGALLTTYVNGAALDAIQGKRGTMTAGAIVVKENYMPDKMLAAITVMYKVKGYNPSSGDWFWAKYTPQGKVEAEGKVAMCLGCHGAKADNDYLFTGVLR